MNKKFNNKTVVICGASAGIGRATALEFAKSGAKLGLISRNQKRLESLQKNIVDLGAECEITVCDAADAEEIMNAAKKFTEKLGPIDIWVNNAMTSVFAAVKNMTPKEYKRVTDVTYLGQVNGALAALNHMLPKNSGKIVFVGSALAYRGIPLQSAYCAAKHAVQGFVDSLRAELMHDKSKISVTMVQLPAFNTPQFEWVKSKLPNRAQPVPPIYKPEIAAKAIVWSALKKRRETIIGWSAFKAIWGNKFFPGMADKFLASSGYDSQLTNEPEESNRPHNLWETVPGEFGVHGRFKSKSRENIQPFWLTTHLHQLFFSSLLIIIILIITIAFIE